VDFVPWLRQIEAIIGLADARSQASGNGFAEGALAAQWLRGGT